MIMRSLKLNVINVKDHAIYYCELRQANVRVINDILPSSSANRSRGYRVKIVRVNKTLKP
jgi:hypothetical protein